MVPASALLRWLGLAAGPCTAALGLYAFLAEADQLPLGGRAQDAGRGRMDGGLVDHGGPADRGHGVPAASLFPPPGIADMEATRRPMRNSVNFLFLGG